MSVDREQTEAIAQLARLHFEPDELDRLTEELNDILDHVQELQSLEAAGPGTTGSDGAPGPEVWRRGATRGPAAEVADELSVAPSGFAPEWVEGFFVVPPLPGVHEGDPE